ncbi:MAG: ABC transporter permease [Planctomycetota bacterium]
MAAERGAAPLPVTIIRAEPQGGAWRHALPWRAAAALWRHRDLTAQLVRRDLRARYVGTSLGWLWLVLDPLFMLALYTLVFSVVFEARWGHPADSDWPGFALTLAAGLVAFDWLANSLTRAVGLIAGARTLIRRERFPAESLALSVALGAGVHAAVQLGVLLAVTVLFGHGLSWQILWLPFVVLPLLLLVVGLTWFVAAESVFSPDLAQAVPFALRLLLWGTPILYPAALLPAALQPLVTLNPLHVIVENLRRITLWDQPPQFSALLIITGLALAVASASYAYFLHRQRSFGDVV